MNIGVLGTGMVGRTIAVRLVEIGHSVKVGTRDPEKTLARTEPDRMGGPSFSVWRQQNENVAVGTFAEAAAFGEMIINATNGSASLSILKTVGETNLNGKRRAWRFFQVLGHTI